MANRDTTWNDIDTAPEGDVVILARIDGEANDCFVHWWAGCWRDGNDTPVNATHWRYPTEDDL